MRISIIIPTHNPNRDILDRTLGGLSAQENISDSWEVILIDNNSTSPISAAELAPDLNLRVVSEPVLGLTAARLRGFREARGEIIVMVDDDNVLDTNYLSNVARIAQIDPGCGAFGGRSHPEFASPPPDWLPEFHGLLALRDLGHSIQHANFKDARVYPECSPIGAGMVLRREALQTWLKQSPNNKLPDRKGGALSSSGDNDIVLSVLESGYSVGYFPELSLLHLISSNRLKSDYLANLNEAMQQSWMQVLYIHNVNPWSKIGKVGAALRLTRAWWRHRPWTSEPASIRYAGAKGHFKGRTNS